MFKRGLVLLIGLVASSEALASLRFCNKGEVQSLSVAYLSTNSEGDARLLGYFPLRPGICDLVPGVLTGSTGGLFDRRPSEYHFVLFKGRPDIRGRQSFDLVNMIYLGLVDEEGKDLERDYEQICVPLWQGWGNFHERIEDSWYSKSDSTLLTCPNNYVAARTAFTLKFIGDGLKTNWTIDIPGDSSLEKYLGTAPYGALDEETTKIIPCVTKDWLGRCVPEYRRD